MVLGKACTTVGGIAEAKGSAAVVVDEIQDPVPTVVGYNVFPYYLAIPGDILIIENRKTALRPKTAQ